MVRQFGLSLLWEGHAFHLLQSATYISSDNIMSTKLDIRFALRMVVGLLSYSLYEP